GDSWFRGAGAGLSAETQPRSRLRPTLWDLPKIGRFQPYRPYTRQIPYLGDKLGLGRPRGGSRLRLETGNLGPEGRGSRAREAREPGAAKSENQGPEGPETVHIR